MTRAVLDVGSNSVLVHVAVFENGEWKGLCDSSTVTALGEGVKETSLLSEEGMDRTLDALRTGFEKARSLGAERVVALATMAARIAANTDVFLRRAAEQGTPVAVLSGDDEARYGFAAVSGDPVFRNEARLSIVDPGGHSTEIVVSEEVELFRQSFPVGSLGLRSRYMPSDPPTREEVFRASSSIDAAMAGYDIPAGGCCVVLGATGTNLISIREKFATWRPDRVHGAKLTFEEVGRAVGWLCAMSDRERASLVGLEPGRERTIHLGALILERAMQALGVESCRVSVRGWRHAVLEDDAWFS
ncbi:MAG: Exopolyphosphatase 2 [Fimbriimonadaceae bacterium]|nr:Exopolyphosphatase 2 [Fimbriimonadaceae bacterium]